MQALEEALSLIDQAQVPYLMAGPTERRLLNQALYQAVYIEDDQDSEATDADLQPLYGQLIPLARELTEQPTPTVQGRKPAVTPRKRTRPLFGAVFALRQNGGQGGIRTRDGVDPHTRLAGECLQPLGHLSRRRRSV